MSTLKLNHPLHEPTPVQVINGRAYKRDDLLAYSNGVNGKIRTALYLADLAVKAGAPGLVYGGSVHAPALGRVASAANYRGLKCKIVVGSDPAKAIRHETVQVAAEAGAELVHSPIAFNPGLQRRARLIAETEGYWQVPYGVSTPDEWTADEIIDFLETDAEQVLPVISQDIHTLVVPFGSANAATSIFYGLSKYGCGSIERVVLVGLGPDRREWFHERLNYLGIGLSTVGEFPFGLEYLPLHPHFAEYTDKMPETVDGIDFHPTYEGKMIRFLDALNPSWWAKRDGTTCMWIVGGPL